MRGLRPNLFNQLHQRCTPKPADSWPFQPSCRRFHHAKRAWIAASLILHNHYLLFNARSFVRRFCIRKMSSPLRDGSRAALSVSKIVLLFAENLWKITLRSPPFSSSTKGCLHSRWYQFSSLSANRWPKIKSRCWNRCCRSCTEPDSTGIIHSRSVACRTPFMQCEIWSTWREMLASISHHRRLYRSSSIQPIHSPLFALHNRSTITPTSTSIRSRRSPTGKIAFLWIYEILR